MGEGNQLRKIVITGPESTGKTELSEALALKLNAHWIPEFARTYVEKLDRPYQYSDLEIIARYQIQQEREESAMVGDGILIFDTWLIITKIWFEVVFGKSPKWLEEQIASSKIDLFLVCRPDLPWIADPVRENGGEMRDRLFDRYCREIEKYGFNLEIVEGFGEARLNCALRHFRTHHIV
ncbi:MAG: ATP-binding protein [Prolixibacteraceae bacterium]